MMEPIDFEDYKREYFRKKALKRAKRKRRFFSLILPILSVALILGTIGTALGIGLSAYFDEQRYYTYGYQIEDCTYVVNEEGETVVTVTFENDALEPVVFTIAKGALGGEGNAIASIESTYDEEGYLTFTITYSDERDPLEFSFPLHQGEDGRFVTSVDTSYDEETHETTLTFNYSDGESPDSVVLPDLYSGEYGFSITDIVVGDVTEDGSLPINVYYTSNTTGEADQIILISKGEDGKTISDYAIRTVGNSYYIDLTMSDGTTYTLTFDFVDDSTSWFYGSGNPNNSMGKEGDFYFDTANDIIYCKETLDGATSPTWNVIFDVHEGEGGFSHPDYCFVTYDLNGGVWENAPQVSTTMMSSVKYGDYAPTSFSGLGNPSRDGMTFIGWYSYADIGNPNAGKLDSLTPIVGDITVYAWYE